jgi:hypothetical protein
VTATDPEIDERNKQSELKKKRNRLFENYLKNPLDISLAREIKTIDDEMAECVEQIAIRRRKA